MRKPLIFISTVSLVTCLSLGLSFFSSPPASAQIPLGGHVYVPSSSDSINGQTNVVMTDANCTLTAPSGCTVQTSQGGTADAPYTGTLVVTSSVPLTATRNIVVPLSPGRGYTVYNKTTGGQSIQIIGSSGTGVVITNSASLPITVNSDGTNYNIAAGGGNVNGVITGPLAATTYQNPFTSYVFGDSISCGQGASNTSLGYAYLYQHLFGGTVRNQCQVGDTAVSTDKAMMVSSVPVTGGYLTVGETFTNDVNNANGGTTNYQNTARLFYQNLVAWSTIPSTSKVNAQTCSTSGFTNDNTYQFGLARTSSTSGNTITCNVTVGASGAVVVGYLLTSGGTGTFTMTINGSSVTDTFSASTTFNAFGYGGVTFSNNATSDGYGAQIFTGYTPGTTVPVVITQTANGVVNLGYVATIPAASNNNPWFLAISPNHQNNANDALSGTYAGFAQSIITQFSSLGANAFYVDTRAALGTNYGAYYADAIHPNDPGHALMNTTLVAGTPAALLSTFPAMMKSATRYPLDGAMDFLPRDGVTAISPLNWPKLNGYRLGDGVNSWGWGLNLYSNGGGTVYGLSADTTHGAYLIGNNSGSNIEAALCGYVNGGRTPSTPSQMVCPVRAQSISNLVSAIIGPASSGNLGGLQAFNGDVAIGGFGSVGTQGAGNAFVNSGYMAFRPTATTSAGVNNPSIPLYFQANGTNTGVPGTLGLGWRNIPTSPTANNPNFYLTAISDNLTPSLWGVDLTGNGLPTLLSSGATAGGSVICTVASPCSSGTVNSGTANQVARYAATGTAVSGSANLIDNGTTFQVSGENTSLVTISGVPSFSLSDGVGWSMTGTGYIGSTGIATGGANFPSYSTNIQASYWNGSTSASDSYTLTNSADAGTNPSTHLVIGHSGSSGAASVDIQNADLTVQGSSVCRQNGTNCPGGIGGTDYYWTQNVGGSCSGISYAAGTTCSGTITTQGTMPNSSWQLFCTAHNPSLPAVLISDDGSRPTTSGTTINVFVYVAATGGGSGTFTPQVDCHAHHN